jgi:ankyrin repeat protein
MFLDHGGNDDLGPMLLEATAHGDNDFIITLLDRGANIDVKNEYGFTPLHIASGNGHTECVKTLLIRGAKVNEKSNLGWAPLHKASCYGHYDCITMLLRYGANSNEKNTDGWTPLYCITRYSNIISWNVVTKCIGAFLDHGANIHESDNYGHTPHNMAKNELRQFIDEYFVVPIKEPDIDGSIMVPEA